MQILNWVQMAGGNIATIQCLDGHVHVPNIREADRPFWEDVIREFVDTLEKPPPTCKQACEHLESLGYEKFEWSGGHCAYRPKPPAPKSAKAVPPKTAPATGQPPVSGGTGAHDGHTHSPKPDGPESSKAEHPSHGGHKK